MKKPKKKVNNFIPQERKDLSLRLKSLRFWAEILVIKEIATEKVKEKLKIVKQVLSEANQKHEPIFIHYYCNNFFGSRLNLGLLCSPVHC